MYVSSVRMSNSTQLLLSLSWSACDLSLPPHSILASGNCLTLVTLLFNFMHYRKPSHLTLQLCNFPATHGTRIYLHISEIPGPQQKAGTAHELKPLSIPPVASGNLQDPVFALGGLGLTHNSPEDPLARGGRVEIKVDQK